MGNIFGKRKRALFWETCLILLKNDYPKKLASNISRLSSSSSTFALTFTSCFLPKRGKGEGRASQKTTRKRAEKYSAQSCFCRREREKLTLLLLFSVDCYCVRVPRDPFQRQPKPVSNAAAKCFGIRVYRTSAQDARQYTTGRPGRK